MLDDKKGKTPKQRMQENKNPTFDFVLSDERGNKAVTKTDTTGLASGKKKFDYSQTWMSGGREGKSRYGTVDREKVVRALSEKSRPDTPLAPTPEPRKIK